MEQARAAEEAVQHAREETQRAETRCAAAEAAKIELSLRLAAALSEQEMAEDVSAVPSASARSVPSSDRGCGMSSGLHAVHCAPLKCLSELISSRDCRSTLCTSLLRLVLARLACKAFYQVPRGMWCSCRDTKQSPEEALQRMEELELAASVASRRASAAEGELHRVKQQLELTDKRAKELAWQVYTSHGHCR